MSAIDPVALAQALIRRPSVTPRDEGAIAVLIAALSPLGFDCVPLPFAGDGGPRTENLYARIGTPSSFSSSRPSSSFRAVVVIVTFMPLILSTRV